MHTNTVLFFDTEMIGNILRSSKVPTSFTFFLKSWHPQGYQKVRVSVIAGSQDDAADFPFSYREAFKYRWTRNFLLSSLVECPGDVQASFYSFLPKSQATKRHKISRLIHSRGMIAVEYCD